MGSLRTLTWLLLLLVLVPAGVLAWLGFQSTGVYDAAIEAQIRRELDDAQARALALAAECLAVAERALDVQLERLGIEVGQEAPRVGLHAALKPLPGRTRFLLGDWRAGPAPVMATVQAARLFDAGGRLLVPTPFHPEGPPGPRAPFAALLDDLRRRADRLQFGARDPAAALALWADARARLAGDVLRATCDVEAALVRLRAGGEAGRAAGLAEEVEAVWSPELLWQVGRPAVRLWLAASRERLDRFAPRFYEAAVDGRLARIPLTARERRWMHELARGWHQANPTRTKLDHGQASRLLHEPEGWTPPNFARRVAVGGATLEVWLGGGSFWAGLREHVRDLLGEGVVDVEVGAENGASRTTMHAGVAIGRVVSLESPGGLRGQVTLLHKRAREWLDGRGVRRLVTLAGVLALLAIVVLGILLVRRAVRRERDARRMRDEFIANVSHELRTPLTSVTMHAEMLAEEDPAPERRRRLARIVRAEGARLAALVDDLLDFSARERGGRRLEIGPVDVLRAARDALAPYAERAAREGVRIDLDAPAADEIAALADGRALARVLANLLSNAWRHGRPGRDGGAGHIRVRVRGEPGRVIVEVRDDGPGLAPDECEAVFERFRRGRAAGTRAGTGIGLSLARELARAMDGELRVVEDAHETVFRLTLPAAPEAEA